MVDKKNIPEVRFKGFGGEWEEKKLGAVYNFQYGQFNINPSDGGIYPVYGANGIIGGYSNFNAENSVVIGHMGEYAGSVLWGEGKHFVTYNGTISTPKSVTVNPKYGYYILYKLNIRKICGGSGQPFLSYETLQKLAGVFPILTAEQTKIGNYFQQLDTLITLHQQKYDKLLNVKKAMLEKMFPKKGVDVPEIRFKGFSEKWEERKLGELCTDFQSGKFIKAEDIKVKDFYPVYGGNGLRGYTDTYNHDGTYALIGRQGALCGNMNISSGKAYFTEHAIAVKANKSSDINFIYYVLGKMKLGQYSGQSAQPGLAVNKLLDLSAFISKLEEQTKIGNFFKKLDTLLTLHQTELEKLKNIKKACLEKMFV